MFHYKAIAFAGVVLVGSADSKEYGNQYGDPKVQSYGHEDYGYHGSYSQDYEYGRPQQYGHYQEGYNAHGYHGGYASKKYERKDMTIVDPKAFFYLMSSFEQCKKHKCEQYGYDNYQYSDDYKTMMSAVGEYVSCNMACGAATLVKASCKIAEDVNKVFQIANHQLEYVSGEVEEEKIREMHLHVGDACVLDNSQFVDFHYITAKFKNAGGEGYFAVDSLSEYCSGGKSRETLAYKAFDIDIERVCQPQRTDAYEALSNYAGQNVLSEECGYQDGSCSNNLQSNPRAAPISKDRLCQPVKMVLNVIHEKNGRNYIKESIPLDLGDTVLGFDLSGKECPKTHDATDVFFGDEGHSEKMGTSISEENYKELLGYFEDCSEADAITHFMKQFATLDKKEETYKARKHYHFEIKTIMHETSTRGRFHQITGNLPSATQSPDEIDIHLAQVTEDITSKALDDTDNGFASSLCTYDSSLTEEIVDMNVQEEVIEAWKSPMCVKGAHGYEFQRIKQWKEVVYQSLTDDSGCKIDVLSHAKYQTSSMTDTLVCAKKVADMKCQCMNAVINCFQQNGYKDSNAVAQTVGKVAALLCAQLLCVSPRNFAQMNGLGAFSAAKVAEVILAQANLTSAPSMSALPPASFAFLAFGMGMFAFVVTQAVLKMRRRNVSESGSSKSLLAAQSTL